MTPGFGGEVAIFSLATEQAGTAKSTGNTGVAEQQDRVHWDPPAARSWAAPQHSAPEESQSPMGA